MNGEGAETGSELTRIVKLRAITDAPVIIEASEAECAGLARRFGLVAVNSLRAQIMLDPDGPVVEARGTLDARIVQSCAVSGDDLPARVQEDIALTFVPARAHDAREEGAEEEIELTAEELDEIEYEGDGFDLGEAVAQGLALGIDPFACGPDAERVRQESGLADATPSGPLAEALAALKKD
jgi:hypothetical protein